MIVNVPTDGFSQPDFEKRWVRKHHGQEVIDALQPIGERHDARVYVAEQEHSDRMEMGFDESWSREILQTKIDDARALLFVEMYQCSVIPNSVAERQFFGLLAYDRLPRCVRWVIRKLTGAGRNDVLREVEI